MRKYRTFRVIVQIRNEEEKEKCYYCNTERKARERAIKDFGSGTKVVYVEEVLV